MPKKTAKKTPEQELVDAVLQMAEEISEACSSDSEWTSWLGNGTNAWEASNVIKPLKTLAEKCKK